MRNKGVPESNARNVLDLLNFEAIWFLKVCNVDKSFKSSSMEFHSVMGDGIRDFCEVQVVLLKGTEIVLLFLRG